LNPRPPRPQPGALPTELHSPSCADSSATLLVARQKGLEPLTRGLEGRCSVHLSYWRESGRADLNGRPPAPKAGALPGCATPRASYRINTPMRASQLIGSLALTRGITVRVSCQGYAATSAAGESFFKKSLQVAKCKRSRLSLFLNDLRAVLVRLRIRRKFPNR
jgi:hypothetical protein